MSALETTHDQLRSKLSIESLDDDPDTWINMLIYGEAGAGKTHLLGTAADDLLTSPVLIFDVEGGLRTLRKFPNKKNIERIPVRSLADIEAKFNEIYKAIDSSGALPWRTIGIDSLTELTDVDMRKIMKDAKNSAPNPEKINEDVPSPREWGIARSHMRKITRAFKDLPCNFVATAMLGTLIEEDAPPKYYPAFSGKLRQELPGFFDIVGYLTTGGNQSRKLQVAKTARVVAKDRDGFIVGGIMEDPTLPKIYQLSQQTVIQTGESK